MEDPNVSVGLVAVCWHVRVCRSKRVGGGRVAVAAAMVLRIEWCWSCSLKPATVDLAETQE